MTAMTAENEGFAELFYASRKGFLQKGDFLPSLPSFKTSNRPILG